VLDLAGRVPRQGEEVEVDGLRLAVERLQGRRILRVRITPPPVDPSGVLAHGAEGNRGDDAGANGARDGHRGAEGRGA
jgi:hypothetical protein